MTTQTRIDSSPGAGSKHDRRPLIAAMIAVATLLFLITSALLYYRWATMNEPNCVIVIEASPLLKGAVISVDNIMFTESLKGTIGENDRYAIPFYVDPGEYQVRVTLGGEVQHQSTVSVSNTARGRKLDLTRLKPATFPTTTGAS